ncbi:sigma-70 family RNA polymerase sigma factor [Pseudomarimonas arenosa]|nr:sigma-70 family RNA polymerase sigma factor [Pseudomarimonas arenosa]
MSADDLDARSDEQLMQAYGHGDGRAFELLYQRNRGRLYAFIARALSPRAAVDDCFQDTWARIIRSRQRYQPTAAFSTWMFQIAHHLIIDQLRRRPAQTGQEIERLLDRPDHTTTDSTPETVQSRFQQARRLQLAIDSLPAEQRIALQLRWNEELSLEEIAEVTDCGRETVKSRLRYGMDKLRALLVKTAADPLENEP